MENDKHNAADPELINSIDEYKERDSTINHQCDRCILFALDKRDYSIPGLIKNTGFSKDIVTASVKRLLANKFIIELDASANGGTKKYRITNEGQLKADYVKRG